MSMEPMPPAEAEPQPVGLEVAEEATTAETTADHTPRRILVALDASAHSHAALAAAVALAASSIPLRIWLARVPPPVASKARVAPVALSASTRSASNEGDVELRTCVAPSPFKISSCSGLRTMLTSAMPSF